MSWRCARYDPLIRATILVPGVALSALAVLALTGCSPADNDPGPGGVSVGEARALDEAAAMIEENSTPPAQPAAIPPAAAEGQ